MIFSSGRDLSCSYELCHAPKTDFGGWLDELGFRAVDAASSTDDVSSLRCQVQWETQGQDVLVSRSVPLYGFLPTDLSREFAGHPGLPSSPTQGCAVRYKVPVIEPVMELCSDRKKSEVGNP
jgi:hypothetical protein